MAYELYPPLKTDECKIIWTQFFNQMLKDATYGLYKRCRRRDLKIKKSIWTPPAGYIPYAREAQLWFLDPTLEFDDICGFIDLNPDAVHENAIEMFKYMNEHVPAKYKVLDLKGNVL